MNKYKVCVYAISKNESKFVDRWYESVKEADNIYVLDTGSTDNTVSKLEEHNITVKQEEINPWRFDVARNKSLDMVEECDICVCIDLDEVIEKGWREKLESIWQENTTRLRYNYNWKLDENNNPIVNFYIEKIHKRHGYKWTHPVHEVLEYNGEEQFITTNLITVNHYPDSNKSRSSYLPLLELSVEEDPKNDRNMHYLGREYMYYQEWQKSIDALKKHLELESATWKDERCASMRFIARCYEQLNNIEEAKKWLNKAMHEAPYLRDPFMERALLEYRQKNFDDVILYCLRALDIDTHTKSYINEPFSWDNTVYDLLSISYYYTGNLKKSLIYVEKAIAMNPKDERLLKNKELFLKKLDE